MLIKIFGNSPQIKVINYLLMNPFGELTKQEIAVGSEISRITLNKFIEDLIGNEILVKEANSKYKVNLKSPIIQKLNLLLDELSKIEIEKQMKNIDESYDELSDEELDIIFDEDSPNVDLNVLEKEIASKETYLIKVNEKHRNLNKYSIAFAKAK
ncbi:hypothetical protein [Methanobrevibacter olleyae]|uniref:Uncharacterized protein n=1 Tax=Methanobrevibacter olleyae TaxID=294671 RepID=A0A126R1T0_METOL|nr:hypothetical protein [Methanobrevibacter olleyae]AMK15575.1 hypothetical protein YLM1_1018 [Methanobrevibacter olleyae]SFL81959.1 hypothetical protein SAMN02910297_01828 [Methanobrevibacter olleyae]